MYNFFLFGFCFHSFNSFTVVYFFFQITCHRHLIIQPINRVWSEILSTNSGQEVVPRDNRGKKQTKLKKVKWTKDNNVQYFIAINEIQRSFWLLSLYYLIRPCQLLYRQKKKKEKLKKRKIEVVHGSTNPNVLCSHQISICSHSQCVRGIECHFYCCSFRFETLYLFCFFFVFCFVLFCLSFFYAFYYRFNFFFPVLFTHSSIAKMIHSGFKLCFFYIITDYIFSFLILLYFYTFCCCCCYFSIVWRYHVVSILVIW